MNVKVRNLYFKGPGTLELNKLIFQNEELFSDAVDFNCAFNSDYHLAINIAVNNFIEITDIEEFIFRCNVGDTGEDVFEKLLFQHVTSDVRKIVSDYVNSCGKSVEELSSYLYSHLIRWSFTSNAYHFVNGLGKPEAEVKLCTYHV